ncbi:MAG: ribonuclease G [Gammaproteobacteria bacterium]|nr:ribonuclease G [Gammaproteobacteria bacterium]
MHEEILVNVTPQETRVAVVENGMLQELLLERRDKLGMVGNIYKGKVRRVLPGMQAAFIDIGLDRAAFLHASDIVSKRDNGCDVETLQIEEMLSEGQTLLVQVIKDPLGTKGARLTTQITIPSRYLVLMPQVKCLGVSSKLEDEDERNRLKKAVAELSGDTRTEGYIVRTAAEGVGNEELKADINYLQKLWGIIREREMKAKPGDMVYEELNLVMRTLRDFIDEGVAKVLVDSRGAYGRMCEFTEKFLPEFSERLEHYTGERPLFDLYNIEDEIQKALQSKVQLKSGGYLIIDQTEAMTTIDVNTGAYVGHRNLEETIFKTNLEAAQAIARQLRLRNLGGIIILDFIDMVNEEHKRQVLRAFEKCIDKDHAKCYLTDISRLGLIEMTRKRTRESLEHVLCEPCSTCAGRGSVKTAQTVCYEIFREIMRESRQFDADKLLILASQEVVDLLLDEESNSVAELEEFIGKPIQFQAEALYSQENYDVVLM